MTNDLINAIVSAIVGAISGGVVSFILEKRKEHREDKKDSKKNNREILENRPELKIIDYKDYIGRIGYGIKKQSDINIFLTRIENVSIADEDIRVQFNEEYFDENEWCCVIYTLKNVGKTDISCINPICRSKKDTILCSSAIAGEVLKYGLISYSAYYDKKVYVGDTITMKVCFHKDCVISGTISALMSMGLEDSNGRCWMQPFFVPDDKIYDAYIISRKEYRDELLPDIAIECFKKPWLW